MMSPLCWASGTVQATSEVISTIPKGKSSSSKTQAGGKGKSKGQVWAAPHLKAKHQQASYPKGVVQKQVAELQRKIQLLGKKEGSCGQRRKKGSGFSAVATPPLRPGLGHLDSSRTLIDLDGHPFLKSFLLFSLLEPLPGLSTNGALFFIVVDFQPFCGPGR